MKTCRYSGLSVHSCKVSDLCDCFDYPEADASALEAITRRNARVAEQDGDNA